MPALGYLRLWRRRQRRPFVAEDYSDHRRRTLTSSVGVALGVGSRATINQDVVCFRLRSWRRQRCRLISLAKEGGIDDSEFGLVDDRGPLWHLAHAISPRAGRLKSVADQIHAAGLKLGSHSLSSDVGRPRLAGGNDPYVSSADRGWRRTLRSPRPSSITSSATTIYVNQAIEGLQTVHGVRTGVTSADRQ